MENESKPSQDTKYQVLSVVFSPNGEYLASGYLDRTIGISSGERITLIKHCVVTKYFLRTESICLFSMFYIKIKFKS